MGRPRRDPTVVRRARVLAPAEEVAPTHPAMVTALLGVAAVLILTVSYVLFEPDFWQHLLVGKVIWLTRSVPDQQIWTWPTYGAQDVTPSWLFRALIWPFWSVGGVWGLFAWRWITTLAVFGLLWATARRMGARGFAALGVFVLCALAYKPRSTVRPESLAAVLMAVSIWILEVRRRGGPDRAPWLLLVAWIWANAHVSYYLGFVLLGPYLIHDSVQAWRGGAPERARLLRLGWVAAAMVAVSFANPFGWRALVLPFEFFLHLRHEPLYGIIGELKAMAWSDYLDRGLLPLVLAWPLLVLWGMRRRQSDVVSILYCLGFTYLAVSAQRFLGFYAVAAAPFVAAGLHAWCASRSWPRWFDSVWLRAGLVVTFCLAVGGREWVRQAPQLRVGIADNYFPIRACDFIATHGLRGRLFNQFYEGGYLLYRFWPERDRLPFMSIHPEGSPRDIRQLYWETFEYPDGWRQIDRRFQFDLVLLDLARAPRNPLFGTLDADSTWALVFADDAAALYLRRDGSCAASARRFAFRHLPGGPDGLGPLGAAVAGDSALRREVSAELERQIQGSPWHANASSLLANIAMLEGRFDEARRLLREGLTILPGLAGAHERLGMMDLAEGRPRDALREFERERAGDPNRPGIALRLGQTWQGLGEPGRAREWYRRELRRDPGNAEARDSLASLDRSSTR